MKHSLHVYVITADVPELGRTHEDVVKAALLGGADILQFRDKTLPDDEFETIARRLLSLCRAKNVPLIINDRVEIAVKIGADGVHVGHEDMPIGEFRKCIPPSMIIGVSARNYEEAIELTETNPDYLGVGPIFPTGSKDDASPPIGTEELRRICQAVSVPIVAIGGITRHNLPQIIQAGAAGAAVISAITHAPDMQRATEDLTITWKGFAQRA